MPVDPELEQAFHWSGPHESMGLSLVYKGWAWFDVTFPSGRQMAMIFAGTYVTSAMVLSRVAVEAHAAIDACQRINLMSQAQLYLDDARRHGFLLDSEGHRRRRRRCRPILKVDPVIEPVYRDWQREIAYKVRTLRLHF